MIPAILVKIALVIIVIRCIVVGVNLLQSANKRWLEILFYFSVALVAIDYFLNHFRLIL